MLTIAFGIMLAVIALSVLIAIIGEPEMFMALVGIILMCVIAVGLIGLALIGFARWYSSL